MYISIIGSGNTAWHLSKMLKASGNKILEVVGRNKTAVTELAKEVCATPNFSFKDIHPESDLILLCVKDDAIEEVANLLPKTKTIVAHTSGFRSKDILKSCSENIGIFYPLQTMQKGWVISFEYVPFLVEGSNKDVEYTLYALAAQLSRTIYYVSEAQRQHIHVAAVFANNFPNHLWALAEKILKSQDLSLDLLRPLMEQSAQNVQQLSPIGLQTGPAVRKDFYTIDEHLKLLEATPEWNKVYAAITESILKAKN